MSSIAHAIAAQFETIVSDTIAEGRLAICEECPFKLAEKRRSSVLGVEYLRCNECDCVLSWEGEPIRRFGWTPKTRVHGEHCPKGMW